MKKLALLSILLLVGVSLNCGYTARSTLPGHMKTVYVEPFKNNISYTSEGGRNVYLPLLEVDARNAIIKRFLFDGNLKIAGQNKADLILRGQLNRYDRGGLRFTDEDKVEEYRVQIFITAELWDVRKQAVVWSESDFAGEATYFLTGTLASSEQSAIDKAIEDLARRIVERTIENW
jgi:hypothetical protein